MNKKNFRSRIRLCWHIKCASTFSKNDVTILDVDQSKVDMVNSKFSPYEDKEFKEFFKQIKI